MTVLLLTIATIRAWLRATKRRSPRPIARLASLSSLAVVVAALAFAVAGPGCYGATEIQVEVTTNVSCLPGATLTTQIFTGATGTIDFGTAPAAETDRCVPEEPRVGTLSVVPTGARDDRFDIEVVGAVGLQISECRSIMMGAAPDPAPAPALGVPRTAGCIVVRRRVSFRPHKSLPLPILLDRSCIGVPCGADQTCDLGICVATSQCDETGCPRERASAPGMDASTAAESSPDAADSGPPPRCGTVPEVVVAGQSIAGPLAMQGADLLYVNRAAGSDGAEVRRVPTAGGAPNTVVTGKITAVAATDTAIAWALRRTLTESAIVLSAGGMTLQSPDAVFVAAALAFVGDALVGFSTTDAFVYTPKVDGGTSIGTVSTSANSGVVPEVISDADGQYYAVVGTSTILHYDRPAGGTIKQLGRLNLNPSVVRPDIAVAKGMLYVAIEPAGAGVKGIYRIARSAIMGNAAPTAPWLALPGTALPTSMAADDRFLYYVAGAELVRVDLASVASADPVVTQLGNVAAGSDRLAIDDQCMYWVENGTTVMKRSK